MKRLSKLWPPIGSYLACLVITIVLDVALGSVTSGFFPANSPLANDLNNAFGAMLGAAGCFASFLFPLRRRRSASRPEPAGQRYALAVWGPVLIGLIFVCQVFVHFVLILENTQLIPQNWHNAANLCIYPLLLCLLLLLPRRSAVRDITWDILLDSIIILLALSTFCWYFLLGPLLLQEEATLLEKLLGILYPLGDLLLLCCFLLLLPRLIPQLMRSSRYLLLLGLTLQIVADSTNAFTGIKNVATPPWSFFISSAAYIVLALATYFLRFDPSRQVHNELRSEDPAIQEEQQVLASFWVSLLPYALIPPLIFLLLSAWRNGHYSPVEQGVYVGSIVLFGLILLRQILTLRQTSLYARQAYRANARLAALATTDPLTELPNHRALDSLLTQELARARRYQYACSVLFLDLDHFKSLNDSYGHAGGDKALSAFAVLVRDCLRLSDSVGRWGGEEFVALLPETQVQDALVIAERIRAAVSMHLFALGGGLHLTCSIGVASFPLHARLHEELVHAADQAMYGAKRLGRNQVRSFDDPAIQVLLGEHESSVGREELSLLGTVKALALLVEKRSEQMGQHSQQVGELALRLASASGLPAAEANMLQLAGQLHDIGHIAVPDALLRKKGPFSSQERAQLELHVEVGAEVVSQVPSLRPFAPLIRGHHERWDGQGYPDRLVGEQIPLGARILTIADAYTVLVSGHLDQPACTPGEALQAIQKRSGSQFDSRLVEVLARLLQELPVPAGPPDTTRRISDQRPAHR